MSFSVYTIDPENRFLRVLARAILTGFPVGTGDISLSRWTILLPTRRSARSLETILLEVSGSKALLLPKIKPIGDIDEDLLADSLPEEGVPDAIAKMDHLHAILQLVVQWATAHPESEMARDVLASGGQAFALAQSLQQLVSQFETEDVDVATLETSYTLDLAGHRQNILKLLEVITQQLPAVLEAKDVIGPAARRNYMIRLEAARVSRGEHKGPIIAAGSTGTNPATRDLLWAIAKDRRGAVVLPGVDQNLDQAAWDALTPEHPQYGLKSMLHHWQLDRSAVSVLGEVSGPRQQLMGWTMRPAAVAEDWTTQLKAAAPAVNAALKKVTVIAADNRQHEAELIALRFRQHVAESKSKAALVTPDRDLATRVKAALARWNLTIDDSAGTPLVHHGKAAMLLLLLRAVHENFSASSLFALLHHPQCRFEISRAEHLDATRTLELAGFRGLPEAKGLGQLFHRLAARREAVTADPHVHPLLLKLTEAQWQAASGLALRLDALLSPLRDATPRPLSEHVNRLAMVLQNLSPASAELSAADQLFDDVMAALEKGSHWHPILPLSQAQHSIVHALSTENLRPPFDAESRLAIYGLAEARLIDVELAILGGLVEGVWPAQPDTGPWLNRPMRDTFKLQQPEREIGVTAHDLVQNFAHPQVVLTWPKRLKASPAIPARWLLRLDTVMKAAGLDPEKYFAPDLQNLQAQLDRPGPFQPTSRPLLRPPVDQRPTRFSVSRVEKLVRDSYWIYAHDILKLLPLDDVGEDVDAGLRGSLIHKTLQAWSMALPHVPASESLALLKAKGQEVFAPYMDMPEVERFWWPRFLRMAQDFEELDHSLRVERLSTLAEARGKIDFDVAGIAHRLTAIADRIDILSNGELRLIDYKSGGIPSIKEVFSGFAPQLTLEAAMVQRRGFEKLNSDRIGDALYLGVGGSRKGVKLVSLASKNDLVAEAEKAFGGLKDLLAAFQRESTAYVPRHNLQMDDQASDYDHLSRRLEWQMRDAKT